MKRKGFKLLALAVITACCFGISAASAFAADGETKTAMNGASIRTIEPTGLRFEAVVDKTTYESVTAENSGKSFGAFILPKDYLTAANITEITNHKNQFTAVEKYLEKEDIAGEIKGSDYVLKYSIADLHYYNYNRVFVGMFFIKTVGADSTVSYQYFTVNAANNERSVAFVAKAAIENASEVPDAAYNFAIAAKYLEANPCNSAEEEPTKKKEAETFVTANKEGFKTAYTAIKTAADIENISLTDEAKITAARTAYDNAEETVIKKLLADCSVYKKFIDNESKYKDLVNSGAVDQVVTLINNLPEYNVSTVPVVYNKNYKTVKAAYDGLTQEQKEKVTNYAKLKKYVDAADKAALVYKDGEYSIYSNTTYASSFIFQITSIPEEIKDYGNISRIYYNNSEDPNLRLKFKGFGGLDLSKYDVVRFPMYLDPEEVGSSTWPLAYKFKGQDAIDGGYRMLKAGWNIVTVPVSKVAAGIEIGANVFAAKTNLYYAIPYAEKLESGDAIASYKYENDGIIIGGATDSFSSSYTAKVDVSAQQDEALGTIMYLDITKAGGAPWNYAFKFTNATELKTTVAETGATSVKFKIKANKASPIYFTEASSSDGAGIKTIGLTTDWQEVELTAEEVAKWNGYFRRDGSAPIQLWISDFTIVK